MWINNNLHLPLKAGCYKCLVDTDGFGNLEEIKADQQVGTQADQFPENEHLQEVGRDDQAEHRRRKQRYKGEEATVAGIAGHITGRIDQNQQGNQRHHKQQSRRNRINQNTHVDFQTRNGQPDRFHHKRRFHRDPPGQNGITRTDCQQKG